MFDLDLEKIPLGKKVEYDNEYNSDLLFPLPRQMVREKVGIQMPLPFKGMDIWHAYEISWLNSKGKPIVAIATFVIPCDSPNLIESKSFKIYLNSFNQTQFSSVNVVKELMQNDLSRASGVAVDVKIESIEEANKTQQIKEFDGICLDQLDVSCDVYKIDPSFLRVESSEVHETVYSHLLKANCLITNQPDWSSIRIEYQGKKLSHEGLLQYIVSYRKHNGFHEQCIEQIFVDIMRLCQPQLLKIYGCFTRRGGLNISVYRSTESDHPGNIRSSRQ